MFCKESYELDRFRLHTIQVQPLSFEYYASSQINRFRYVITQIRTTFKTALHMFFPPNFPKFKTKFPKLGDYVKN